MNFHPVFAQALEDADEKIARVEVSPGSSMADHTFEKLDLWRRKGVYTLVLVKGEDYILNPSRGMVVRPDDRLIIRGSSRGVEELIEVAGGRKDWAHLG